MEEVERGIIPRGGNAASFSCLRARNFRAGGIGNFSRDGWQFHSRHRLFRNSGAIVFPFGDRPVRNRLLAPRPLENAPSAALNRPGGSMEMTVPLKIQR